MRHSGATGQLALDVQLREGLTFAAYHAGPNTQAARHLRDLIKPTAAGARGSEGQQVYLWGATGTGKTHLLQAVCREFNAHGRTAVYIPLMQLASHGPAVIDELDSVALIAVDELDVITGMGAWEAALFKLINECRSGHRPLVLASRENPTRLRLGLADLASRLVWGPVYQLKALNDQQKLDTLQERARMRGITLSPQASRYLLNHRQRDLLSLLETLERLDKAALAAKRRVTVPFIKSVLG